MAGLIRSVKESSAGFIQYLSFPVLSTSTFKKGDFLTKDSNGKLQQALSAGSNFGSSDLIAGQAQSDALDDNGVVRPYIQIAVARPGAFFWIPIYNGTPASAVFTPGTSTTTAYEVRYVSATAGFAIDNSATSNPKARILDVWIDDYPGWPVYNGVGTVQYPLVLIEFQAAQCACYGGR